MRVKNWSKNITQVYINIVLLHINDPYEAEDLTQEVFTRFFSNLYRYKEYGKVKNYLYTIAGNTVKNYYKRKRIFHQRNC